MQRERHRSCFIFKMLAPEAVGFIVATSTPSVQHVSFADSPLSVEEASGFLAKLLRVQVSVELAGRCQQGARTSAAAASSSMVCLHPGAVTFSCVRSMNHLLSSQHSCTCMAFARLGGEFCQAQHLMLIVDK